MRILFCFKGVSLKGQGSRVLFIVRHFDPLTFTRRLCGGFDFLPTILSAEALCEGGSFSGGGCLINRNLEF